MKPITTNRQALDALLRASGCLDDCDLGNASDNIDEADQYIGLVLDYLEAIEGDKS